MLEDFYAVYFLMIIASELVLVNANGHPVGPSSHKLNAANFF
jgi:hypothetical protein